MNIAYTLNEKPCVSSIAPGIAPERAAAALNLDADSWQVVSEDEAARIRALQDPLLMPEEKREAAYHQEADPLFREAQFYQTEAEGLKALGDYDGAEATEAKATELKKSYALKKAEIRERFPNEFASPIIEKAFDE